jgi:hypothetical protein
LIADFCGEPFAAGVFGGAAFRAHAGKPLKVMVKNQG